jgi:hypothetical protein
MARDPITIPSPPAPGFRAKLFPLASCFCVLLLAPLQPRDRSSRRTRQPSVRRRVDIQVHLEDANRVELSVIRQTLRRAARTWAPLPLPVDRIVVGATFLPAAR